MTRSILTEIPAAKLGAAPLANDLADTGGNPDDETKENRHPEGYSLHLDLLYLRDRAKRTFRRLELKFRRETW
jgi:hypothetical protein